MVDEHLMEETYPSFNFCRLLKFCAKLACNLAKYMNVIFLHKPFTCTKLEQHRLFADEVAESTTSSTELKLDNTCWSAPLIVHM